MLRIDGLARARHLLRSVAAISILLVDVGCDACTAGTDQAAQTEHQEAEPEEPPNVVLMVIDTLRADHLSQYGYSRATGEPLQEFAEEATRFTRSYSPAGWTVPSVASLMTGTLPARHQTLEVGDKLRTDFVTLAELLQEEGWQTLGFSHNVHICNKTQYSQGFDRFADFGGRVLHYPPASEMADEAIEWIEGQAGDGSSPFLLYFQPMNCHGPYKVPKAHRDQLLGRPPATDFRYYKAPMTKILKGQLEQREEVDEALLRSLHEQYDTAIHYTLGQMARVLQALREAEEYDDSLIIITADHGEELFDHGGFSHAWSLFDEVLHVPLFIKLPGQQHPRTVETPVSLTDIYPTIAEILDLKPPKELQGKSLAALTRGREPAQEITDRAFLFQTDWKTRCIARAVRRGRYKLIKIQKNYEGLRDAVQLYDVEADPGETHDLSEQEPEVVAAHERLLEELLEASAAAPGERPDNVREELDEALLRSLGYSQ